MFLCFYIEDVTIKTTEFCFQHGSYNNLSLYSSRSYVWYDSSVVNLKNNPFKFEQTLNQVLNPNTQINRHD